MHEDDGQGRGRDVLIGALAGAFATWIMGKATTVLYEREPKAARKQEDKARGDLTAYGAAAEKLAGLVGAELTDEQLSKAGKAIHYGLGAGAGAAYGAARRGLAPVSAGHGLLYGSAFWLAADELATPLLGLTPGPKAFPWQTHARGLAGHLVFGAVLATVFTITDHLP